MPSTSVSKFSSFLFRSVVHGCSFFFFFSPLKNERDGPTSYASARAGVKADVRRSSFHRQQVAYATAASGMSREVYTRVPETAVRASPMSGRPDTCAALVYDNNVAGRQVRSHVITCVRAYTKVEGFGIQTNAQKFGFLKSNFKNRWIYKITLDHFGSRVQRKKYRFLNVNNRRL